MTARTLRVPLRCDVSRWPLSRAQAHALRQARKVLAEKGMYLVADPTNWTFEPREGDAGPLVMAVCLANVETRTDVVARAQQLMAERNEHIRCKTCDLIAEVDTRHDAGQTISDACRQVGVSVTTHRNHRHHCTHGRTA
jgi:hypothetical protein